ncbi:MAG: hypothetical protein ACXWT1_12635 [Methylobacter sp.]
MLEGLFSQLAKPTPPIIKVPPVPSHKTQGESLQATNDGAVPLVPPVLPHTTKVETKNTNSTLTAADRQKLLDYMAAIGETDQALIDELLTKCTTDSVALIWALSWAEKVRVKPLAPLALITCRNCTHFKSFNKHGGGAGLCCVGVWSAGYHRWSDTIHQCGNYRARAMV